MFAHLFIQPKKEKNKLNVIKGNLFDGKDEAIAHGCNTIGVMGAGIAKQFRIRYPDMFKVYLSFCIQKAFNPGDFLRVSVSIDKRDVYCLATQTQLGPHAKLEWIETSLRKVLSQQNPPKTLGLPLIGAGIGGLKANEVLKLFEKLAQDYPNTQITVYKLQ